MAKRGRKSSFNSKIQETILRLLKEGKTEEQVARVIGVSTRTLSNWKGKHVELLHAIRESKLLADELVEASLFRRAVGYSHKEIKFFAHEGVVTDRRVVEKHHPPDTTAAMFWLRNRQPKKWREKTESDVNINNFSNLTDEQLDARLEEMLAKREK